MYSSRKDRETGKVQKGVLEGMKSVKKRFESRSMQQHIWGSGKKSARLKQRLYLDMCWKKARQQGLGLEPYKFWSPRKSLKQGVVKKAEPGVTVNHVY